MKDSIKFFAAASLNVFLLATVSGGEATDSKWGNRLVEFSFDAAEGTYSITDKRDNSVVIASAVFQINQYVSDQGYVYHCNSEKVTDELGQGTEDHH